VESLFWLLHWPDLPRLFALSLAFPAVRYNSGPAPSSTRGLPAKAFWASAGQSRPGCADDFRNGVSAEGPKGACWPINRRWDPIFMERRFTGCAGINRHVVANERVVQERRSESILAPNLAVNIARC
jgi:hypothetical protein